MGRHSPQKSLQSPQKIGHWNWYAVILGDAPGVYHLYEMASAAADTSERCILKGFNTEDEAWAWVHNTYPVGRITRPTPSFYPFGEPGEGGNEPGLPPNHPQSSQQNTPATPVRRRQVRTEVVNSPRVGQHPTTSSRNRFTTPAPRTTTQSQMQREAGSSNNSGTPEPSDSRLDALSRQIAATLLTLQSHPIAGEAPRSHPPTTEEPSGNAKQKARERAPRRVLEHDRSIEGDIVFTEHVELTDALLQSLRGQYSAIRPSSDITGLVMGTFYSAEVVEYIEGLFQGQHSFDEFIDMTSSRGMAINEALLLLILNKFSAFPRADVPPEGY